MLNLNDFTSSGIVNLSAFNTALAVAKSVHIPRGIYEIDTDVGIVVPNNCKITGEGIGNSVLVAKNTGATLAQLASYTKGSVIKRSAPSAGVYVTHCSFSDFSIHLTHPGIYNSSNYRQIGMDLRNITRSFVERVYVGNGSFTSGTSTDKLQGYGFVLGTSNAQYCGGVGNTLRDCVAYLNYKNYTQDDLTLCDGTGGAHKTLVDNFDSEWAQYLFYVEQTSSGVAGCEYRSLILQAENKQPGSAEPSYAFYFGGFDSRIHIGYQEYNDDSVTVVLSSGSNRNVLEVDHPASISITDNGTNNIINGDRTTGGGGSSASVYYNGNTNNSSSGSGSDFLHNLVHQTAANALALGKSLRITATFNFSTSASPPSLGIRLYAGATKVCENSNNGSQASVTDNAIAMTWIITPQAAPSASSAVSVANIVQSQQATGVNYQRNTVTQPIALPTNATIDWKVATYWSVPGSGGTTDIKLDSLIAELI